VHFGKHCLAPLTGTDHKALAAAAQIIALYAYARAPEAIDACGKVVRRMQPSTQHHAIAHGLIGASSHGFGRRPGYPRCLRLNALFRVDGSFGNE